MRVLLAWLLVLVACAKSAPAPVAPAAELARRDIERVVVVSIDGLRPSDCARLPTLGMLAKEGAFAAPPQGALSVMPTVTYPAHTTIATGVRPLRHGIYTNLASDPTPDRKNKYGWRWYHEDVRAPTIYDVAFEAGLKTALINWPVTVGAKATALVPEYSRAGTREDLKLIRQLSTPGLLAEIERRYPSFHDSYAPPEVRDDATIDAALTVLDLYTPHLLMLHIWQTDSKQHEFGPDTPEAELALREADAQVARLLAALRASESWPRTVLVIASDHGFLRIHTLVAPLVHLAAAGLGERVWMDATGATAYLYTQVPADAEAEAQTRALFDKLVQDPASGLARVMDRQAIAELGGDPDAFLALEAAPGFAMARESTGEAQIPAVKKGVHGYLPERMEMRATLLFYGPRISASTLTDARLLDVAPTLAAWLGLTLSGAEGKPLPIPLR